jgi:hypothetical protein
MRVGRNFLSEARREYVDGATYRLGEVGKISAGSRGHQFAFLKEAWKQLPEEYAQEYPSPKHFRKALLIDAGFYDQETIDVGSQKAAVQVAMALRQRDDFAKIAVRGGVVVIRTAKSQSDEAMDSEEFQRSKTAILEIAANMLGITPEDLQQNTGKAA